MITPGHGGATGHGGAPARRSCAGRLPRQRGFDLCCGREEVTHRRLALRVAEAAGRPLNAQDGQQ